MIDKTVPDVDRNEHRSFNWVLNHNRIVKPDHQPYSITEDYFGFFPKEDQLYETRTYESKDSLEIVTMSNDLDVLYFADAYGVYYNDWYGEPVTGEISHILFGGLTETDFLLLDNAKKNKKLVITEFNLIATPTKKFIRNKVERSFDFKWTGWVGRYFIFLDTLSNPELPAWIIKRYVDQYDQPWSFTKSGIVMVHDSIGIVVLENETHLVNEVPYIHATEEGMEKYGLPDSVHYPFWFDIIESGDTNTTYANYKLSANEAGKQVLQTNGIPEIFPAVIASKEPYNYYYFAGDFADNPVKNYTAYFKGIRNFDYFLYLDEVDNRARFFWNFYIPLIENILKDFLKEQD